MFVRLCASGMSVRLCASGGVLVPMCVSDVCVCL